MGALGKALHSMGGEVYGVKPRPFLKYEIGGVMPSFDYEVELVDDLHTQKRRMVELSDAFVVLPGGFGTLEELVAIRMWSKLGLFPTIPLVRVVAVLTVCRSLPDACRAT